MTRASRPVPLLLLLALTAGTVLAQSAGEASEAKTGYMVIDHQLYEEPLGASVGVVEEGEHVRAKPVPGRRGWYEIARLDGEGEEKLGYVVEPFIWDEVPDEPLAAGGEEADAGEAGTVRPASTPPLLSAPSEEVVSEGEIRYVHQYTNVRSAPSANGEIVAQLRPGAAVEVGAVAYDWASVSVRGREIGHVWLPLLAEDPPSEVAPVGGKAPAEEAPSDERERAAPVAGAPPVAEPPPTEAAPAEAEPAQTTTVYVTRHGEKYHREGCRFLRHSKFARTLEEALGEDYEACKVCRPPKPEEEL